MDDVKIPLSVVESNITLTELPTARRRLVYVANPDGIVEERDGTFPTNLYHTLTPEQDMATFCHKILIRKDAQVIPLFSSMTTPNTDVYLLFTRHPLPPVAARYLINWDRLDTLLSEGAARNQFEVIAVLATIKAIAFSVSEPVIRHTNIFVLPPNKAKWYKGLYLVEGVAEIDAAGHKARLFNLKSDTTRTTIIVPDCSERINVGDSLQISEQRVIETIHSTTTLMSCDVGVATKGAPE